MHLIFGFQLLYSFSHGDRVVLVWCVEKWGTNSPKRHLCLAISCGFRQQILFQGGGSKLLTDSVCVKKLWVSGIIILFFTKFISISIITNISLWEMRIISIRVMRKKNYIDRGYPNNPKSYHLLINHTSYLAVTPVLSFCYLIVIAEAILRIKVNSVDSG